MAQIDIFDEIIVDNFAGVRLLSRPPGAERIGKDESGWLT